MNNLKNSKVLVFIIVILSGIYCELMAQKVSMPMLSSTKEGVHIIIRGRYSDYTGFNVYRKDRGFGKEYELLTETPVFEINDLTAAQETLGAYWDYLQDFLQTKDPYELLLRMKSPDVATILRYCGVPFAEVLGRHYFDSTAQWGEDYTYKIELLNSRGIVFESVEFKYKVIDELPQHSTTMNFEQDKTKIHLKWTGPVYREDVTDDFVGFNLYRKYNNTTKRLNMLPVLRREDILWIDDKAVEERTYEYQIKPVDVIGREGKIAATLSVYVRDLIPPLVPMGLTAEKDYEKIHLTWLKGEAPDIVNYKVFRAPTLNSDYTEIGKTDGQTTKYTDLAVIGGKAYFYKIQAVDNVGNHSLISPAIYSVPQDTSAPEPPQNVTFEIMKDKSVLLKWESPPSPDLQGYFVSRGYKSNKSVNLTPESITENQFIDQQKFNPGHTYYYHISAIDLTFNQSEIKTVKVRIPDDRPPYTPKTIDCSLTEEGHIEVIWQPSMSLDVMAYNIYRYEGDDKTLIKTFGREPYSFIDSQVEQGKRYSYSVIAIDSLENTSGEVKSRTIVSKDIMPPPKPEITAIEISKKGVMINWDCEEAPDVIGYNVYRSGTKYSAMTKINTEVLKNKSYTDKKGRKGKYYKVTTLDTSGNETTSEVVRAK